MIEAEKPRAIPGDEGSPAKCSTVTVVPANMGDLSAMVGSLLSQAGNAKPGGKS